MSNPSNLSFLDRAKVALTGPLAKAIGISVVSAGAGAAGGYYFAKHKMAKSSLPEIADVPPAPALPKVK